MNINTVNHGKTLYNYYGVFKRLVNMIGIKILLSVVRHENFYKQRKYKLLLLLLFATRAEEIKLNLHLSLYKRFRFEYIKKKQLKINTYRS